jgi:hypothetical protein
MIVVRGSQPRTQNPTGGATLDGYLTTGKLALRVGVQEHHIRVLAKRG